MVVAGYLLAEPPLIGRLLIGWVSQAPGAAVVSSVVPSIRVPVGLMPRSWAVGVDDPTRSSHPSAMVPSGGVCWVRVTAQVPKSGLLAGGAGHLVGAGPG